VSPIEELLRDAINEVLNIASAVVCTEGRAVFSKMLADPTSIEGVAAKLLKRPDQRLSGICSRISAYLVRPLMSAAIPSTHRFIGRQAILDSKMRLYGYELLFRAGTDNAFSGNVEDATNQIIDSCLSMIACSSSKNLFINCTRDSLVSMNVKLLPSKAVVLEILETVTADAEVVRACKELKQCGFRLALDDFSPYEAKGELVDIADYVKVDFRTYDPAARQEIYKIFRRQKTIFLAEKVETLVEVLQAETEGNTLFQGYFHARPEIIAESQISTGKAVYLQLLGALAKSPMEVGEIERLLLLEPSLCYRLLRLANSATYGVRNRVSTIQAALNTVGEDAFRKLVTVVVAGRLAPSTVDRDTEQALERAYLCESLATILNEDKAELYMLGMFSMMDRMLNIPMKQLVELISIDSRLQEALLGSEKGIGRALALCRYEEQGGDSQGLPHPDESVPDSSSYYFRALIATGNTLQRLQG
jgi:c-di-GMP-related signal transduction protein